MTDLSLRVEPALDRLGPEWDRLFDAGESVQTSRAWFTATAEAALPTDAEPHYLAVSGASGPLVLLAMLEVRGRAWQSLTTPYTCLWQPLVQPGLADHLAVQAFATIGRHCRRYAITRLEALDPAWPGLTSMIAGFRAAGLSCRRFDHFANWYATTADGWDGYLSQRPGALRETIRRKTRAIGRDAGIRIEIAVSEQEIARALPAYEAVYAQSWKEAEPFPRFNQTVVAHVARTGRLRMFILWSGERPVAAQYWTVTGGCATVLKLAHDEQEKRLSPGTVLTATAIRHLIERERIHELDFGRGDDPYKRSWTGERRQRIGVLGLNARTGQGLMTVARHDLGRLRRKFSLLSRPTINEALTKPG